MTLDEAICHCLEKAKELRDASCNYCAEDHEQLAEWLEELKERRLKDPNIHLLNFLVNGSVYISKKYDIIIK